LDNKTKAAIAKVDIQQQV